MQSMDADFRQVMGGTDHSIRAAALRAVAGCAEPIYAGIMRLRNSMYDAGVRRIHRLDRPTISVGNITVGGTGKTPVVRWLARSLADRRPCVLLRGYKSTSAGVSDEQAFFAADGIFAVADPDRRCGAGAALRQQPETNLFILDDGMQHRPVARDFELVLIHAREPFGSGHVFPRGTLREPLAGLRRADAILLTHSEEASAAELADISKVLQRHNPRAAVFHADHVIESFRSAEGELIPAESLAGKRYFALCGIGSPESFFWRLGTLGGTRAAVRAFADHHDYRQPDVSEILSAAASADAEVIVTTEKDWVKLSQFASTFSIPLWRAQLTLRFWPEHEQRLLEMIRQRLEKPST
jgi:tetraacyldisaccharide 4'-kinase